MTVKQLGLSVDVDENSWLHVKILNLRLATVLAQAPILPYYIPLAYQVNVVLSSDEVFQANQLAAYNTARISCSCLDTFTAHGVFSVCKSDPIERRCSGELTQLIL